ncbi:MAG: tetratricopeptide repeat protein [Deltaproteobacteria bacterium]|nr:tetratricopeptide repeat protein [Deltaproteobacteria bacterium]
MRARWLSLSLVLAAVFAAPTVFAEGKGDKDAKKSDTSGKKGTKADADGVRRDPKGITGITPTFEAVLKGNAAYAAKDWDKAMAAYKDAIEKDSKDPLGYYMLGEAQLAAGKLDDAGQSWQTALKTSANDDVMHAKALFVIADLKERQGKLEEAAAAWKEYGTYAGAHPKAKGYAATATERQKAIDTHNDVAAKAAKVKQRIQQREQEQLEQAKTPTPPAKKK